MSTRPRRQPWFREESRMWFWLRVDPWTLAARLTPEKIWVEDEETRLVFPAVINTSAPSWNGTARLA